MCNFFEVLRSVYYSWVSKSDIEVNDSCVAKMISESQQITNQTYGYRRVKVWLKPEYGIAINHKAVLRIMNKYNLFAQVRKRCTILINYQGVVR